MKPAQKLQDLARKTTVKEQNHYKLLVENSPSCICEITFEGRIFSMNQIGQKMLADLKTSSNFTGQNFFDFISPRDKGRIEKLFQKALQGETSRFEFTANTAKNDLCLSSSFIPLLDKDQNVFRVMNISYDITDHKKTENMLFNAQKKYRSVIDNIPDVLIELSDSGEILFVNKLDESYSLDKVIGSNARDFADPEYRPVIDEAFQKVVETGSSQEYIARTTRPSGEQKWWSNRLSPLMQNGKPSRYLLICQDITAKKQAEEEKQIIMDQLFQAQKLESLGKLAGGVAHEFNNLLAVILLHCAMLWDEIQGHADSEEALDIIVKSAERAEELTNQLLGFARKGKYGSKPIQLNNIITEATNLLKASVGKQSKLKLILDLSESLELVMGSESQVLQILMNLGLNAIDAMPNGGKLTFKSFNRKADKNNYACIQISDTGEGIEKENLKKIFDPFFTTKDIGKGTGLGLSMTYGIMENHGGRIEVKSKINSGTTFFLYFPILEGEKS